MKYRAGIEPDRGDFRAMVAADFGMSGPTAYDAEEDRVLRDVTARHAKALLAVVEAAKKTERLRRTSKAGAKAERAWWNACNAESVAVAALERVEKEVRRVHRELEKQHG